MFLRKALISFIVVPIVFIALETLLFFFRANPKEINDAAIFNAPTTEAINNRTFLKDRLLLWKLRPSQNFLKKFTNDKFNGNYAINSLGLRGKDFPIEKNKDTFRLVCLGDSITFGWRVEFEDAYPERLEAKLRSGFRDKNVEVINAGVLGYSSLQGLRLLERDIIKLKPDIVIVYFGIDDGDKAVYFSDKYLRIKSDVAVSIDNFLNRSRFYRLLKNFLLKFIGNKKYERDRNTERSRVSPEDYRVNLEDMVSLLNSKNIPLLVMLPIIYENGFSQKLQRYDVTENLSLKLTGKNIKYINVLSAFKKVKDQQILFFDNSHPTELGHEIMAEEIFRTLVEERLIQKLN
jgi:lysophospholipase L1-like esterase